MWIYVFCFYFFKYRLLLFLAHLIHSTVCINLCNTHYEVFTVVVFVIMWHSLNRVVCVSVFVWVLSALFHFVRSLFGYVCAKYIVWFVHLVYSSDLYLAFSVMHCLETICMHLRFVRLTYFLLFLYILSSLYSCMVFIFGLAPKLNIYRQVVCCISVIIRCFIYISIYAV